MKKMSNENSTNSQSNLDQVDPSINNSLELIKRLKDLQDSLADMNEDEVDEKLEELNESMVTNATYLTKLNTPIKTPYKSFALRNLPTTTPQVSTPQQSEETNTQIVKLEMIQDDLESDIAIFKIKKNEISDTKLKISSITTRTIEEIKKDLESMSNRKDLQNNTKAVEVIQALTIKLEIQENNPLKINEIINDYKDVKSKFSIDVDILNNYIGEISSLLTQIKNVNSDVDLGEIKSFKDLLKQINHAKKDEGFEIKKNPFEDPVFREMIENKTFILTQANGAPIISVNPEFLPNIKINTLNRIAELSTLLSIQPDPTLFFNKTNEQYDADNQINIVNFKNNLFSKEDKSVLDIDEIQTFLNKDKQTNIPSELMPDTTLIKLLQRMGTTLSSDKMEKEIIKMGGLSVNQLQVLNICVNELTDNGSSGTSFAKLWVQKASESIHKVAKQQPLRIHTPGNILDGITPGEDDQVLKNKISGISPDAKKVLQELYSGDVKSSGLINTDLLRASGKPWNDINPIATHKNILNSLASEDENLLTQATVNKITTQEMAIINLINPSSGASEDDDRENKKTRIKTLLEDKLSKQEIKQVLESPLSLPSAGQRNPYLEERSELHFNLASSPQSLIVKALEELARTKISEIDTTPPDILKPLFQPENNKEIKEILKSSTSPSNPKIQSLQAKLNHIKAKSNDALNFHTGFKQGPPPILPGHHANHSHMKYLSSIAESGDDYEKDFDNQQKAHQASKKGNPDYTSTWGKQPKPKFTASNFNDLMKKEISMVNQNSVTNFRSSIDDLVSSTVKGEGSKAMDFAGRASLLAATCVFNSVTGGKKNIIADDIKLAITSQIYNAPMIESLAKNIHLGDKQRDVASLVYFKQQQELNKEKANLMVARQDNALDLLDNIFDKSETVRSTDYKNGFTAPRDKSQTSFPKESSGEYPNFDFAKSTMNYSMLLEPEIFSAKNDLSEDQLHKWHQDMSGLSGTKAKATGKPRIDEILRKQKINNKHQQQNILDALVKTTVEDLENSPTSFDQYKFNLAIKAIEKLRISGILNDSGAILHINSLQDALNIPKSNNLDQGILQVRNAATNLKDQNQQNTQNLSIAQVLTSSNLNVNSVEKYLDLAVDEGKEIDINLFKSIEDKSPYIFSSKKIRDTILKLIPNENDKKKLGLSLFEGILENLSNTKVELTHDKITDIYYEFSSILDENKPENEHFVSLFDKFKPLSYKIHDEKTKLRPKELHSLLKPHNNNGLSIQEIEKIFEDNDIDALFSSSDSLPPKSKIDNFFTAINQNDIEKTKQLFIKNLQKPSFNPDSSEAILVLKEKFKDDEGFCKELEQLEELEPKNDLLSSVLSTAPKNLATNKEPAPLKGAKKAAPKPTVNPQN
jgi:hypothetical protein